MKSQFTKTNAIYYGPKDTKSMRPESMTVYIKINIIPRVVRVLGCLTNGKENWTDVSTISRRIVELYSINGKTFTVKYLKVCYMIVVTQISGVLYKPAIGDPLVRITKDGLPAIIPIRLRDGILTKSGHGTIRLVLSIFSLYRVIRIPSNLKLGTITDPFSGVNRSVDKDLLRRAIVRLWGPNITVKRDFHWTFAHSSSAGPNAKVSTISIWPDAIALINHPSVLYNWFKFTGVFGNKWDLRSLYVYSVIISLITWKIWYPKSRKTFYIGRLLTKEEAAGKVRVLCVADWWTQNAFKPLHKYLFSLLKKLPTDGTIDQDACVRRLISMNQESDYVGSFDLSAATDRLPVDIQKDILSYIIGSSFSNYWERLMTDRYWDFKGEKIKYSVGQPIGAYSSWAILAVTHHIIVQICAEKAGVVPNGERFERYAVLGDDIVIFDKEVSGEYLTFIRNLGVGINISKSVISEGTQVFEFAKRIIVKDQDLSAIGPKAALIASTYPSIVSVVLVDAAKKSSFTREHLLERLRILMDEGLLASRDTNRTIAALFGPGGITDFKASQIVDTNSDQNFEIVIPVDIIEARTAALTKAVRRRVDKIAEDLRTRNWEAPIDSWIDLQISWEWIVMTYVHPASVWWIWRVRDLMEEINDRNWNFAVIPCRGFKRMTFERRLQYHKELIGFDFGKYNLTFAQSPVEEKKNHIASLGSLIVEAHELLQKETGVFIVPERDLDWGWLTTQNWVLELGSEAVAQVYTDQNAW